MTWQLKDEMNLIKTRLVISTKCEWYCKEGES